MPWKKGQSGNPGGRPKGIAEITALCQQKSPAATKRIFQLIESEDERVALAAAQTVLDRAYGKPMQHSTVNLSKHDATDWTRDELVALLHDARAGSHGAAKADGREPESSKIH